MDKNQANKLAKQRGIEYDKDKVLQSIDFVILLVEK